MKKNDIIELEITDVTSEGSGVGHHEGMAVFVPAAAAGDVISCRIVKVNKSYCFGIIENILVPSPDRTESSCNISKKCGGCVFRHISYEAELKIKDKAVRDAFKRLGGLDIPFDDILGCDPADRYRNKAQYPVACGADGKNICGFYAPRSHRVIPCTDCSLQPEIFGQITKFILRYTDTHRIKAYNEADGTGLLRHIYLRRGYHSGEIMVCLIVTKPNHLFDKLCGILTEKFPEIKSIVLNINSRNTNVITGDKCVTIYGNDTISDTMCGRKIEISPLSFYQVNTAQAERLYGIAGEYAGLTGSEVLLDLYCGAGTVGLSMSDRISKLIGGEIIPQAVENARRNAAANGIVNAEFICGDAGQIADTLLKKGTRPDVIVIDPPRKGCDELTLSSIVKMAPDRVVMISCNPATAARDAAFLSDNGYRAVMARAVDMFPRTGHVECVCKFTKK